MGLDDVTYKKFFSNPILVEELLRYFVYEEFVHHLDFSTLEKVSESFINNEFKEKESDMIWKVHFKGEPLYIYLLLEFQSTSYTYMPLKFLRYIIEFYDFLIQPPEKKGKKRRTLLPLPSVFPILLYNGEEKWSAKEDIYDLIRHDIPDAYIPKFKYYKIAENEIPKESLLKIKNAVSAIFFVENSDVEELRKEFRNVLGLIKKENPEIVKLFQTWLNQSLGEVGKEFSKEIHDILEEESMYSAAVKRFKEKCILEGKILGIEQGIEQGIDKGKLLDKQEVLIKLMDKKFDLSLNEKEFIRSITDMPKLDDALDIILFATSKEEVLNGLH